MTVSLDPAALRRLDLAGRDFAATLARIATDLDDALLRHVRATDPEHRVHTGAPAAARAVAASVEGLHTWAGRVGRAVEAADRADGPGFTGFGRVQLAADAVGAVLGDLAFGPAGPPTPAQRAALAGQLSALLDEWAHHRAVTLDDADDALAAVGRLRRLAALLDELAWHAQAPHAAAALLAALPDDVLQVLPAIAEDAGRLVSGLGWLGIEADGAIAFRERWDGPALRSQLVGPLTALLAMAARHPDAHVDEVVAGYDARDVGRLLTAGVPPSRELVVALGRHLLGTPRHAVVLTGSERVDEGWLDLDRPDPWRPLLVALADDPTAAAEVLADGDAAAHLIELPNGAPATTIALVGDIVGAVRAVPSPRAPSTASHDALHALIHAGATVGVHEDLRDPFAALLATNLAVLTPDLGAQGAVTSLGWGPAQAGPLGRAVQDVAGQLQFDASAADRLLAAVLAELPLLVGDVVTTVAAATPADGPIQLDPATQQIANAAALAGAVVGGAAAAGADREARRRRLHELSSVVAAVVTATGPARRALGVGQRPARDLLADELADFVARFDPVTSAALPDQWEQGDHFEELLDQAVRLHAAEAWGPDAVAQADAISTALRDRLGLEKLEAFEFNG